MRPSTAPQTVKKSNTTDSRDTDQSGNVTRRRFLATSAAGVAGLGALGSLGSAAAAPDEHTLVIEGFGPKTTYSFTVDDNLEKSTANGAGTNGGDNIIRKSAHGEVTTGKDAYTFTGPLYAFNFEGSDEINVTLDGKPARVGNRPDHVLSIEGFGMSTDYSFVVSSDDAPKETGAYGGKLNPNDNADHSVAHGKVISGIDSWSFNGDLRAFNFDESGEISVLLDGKPARVGQRPDHTFDVLATGGYTTYEFSASGSVYADRDVEEGQDTVSGSSASGAVSGDGDDYYAFDGEITSLEADGGAALVRDGQRIDASDY